MHHLVVKNNLIDRKTTLGYKGRGDGGNNLPVCPKPCRPRSNATINPRELVKPFKSPINAQSKATNLDGRSDILNMIITDKKTTEDREYVCFYTGSPPQRTDNPLIHGVQFVNRMKLFSPLASLKN